MKKILNFIFVFFGLFIFTDVYADTFMGVGETTNIFEDSTCIITSCVSNSSAVTLNFTEKSCQATGVGIGEAEVKVMCNGDPNPRIVNLNIQNKITNNNNGAGANSTLHNGTGNAQVNCSTLGELRNDLNGAFKVFKIVAPILVFVMSAFDFIKAFTGKVEGEMKKAFSKFSKRIIFAVILFFLPTILDLFLGLIDSGYTTCIDNNF